jgi:tRNA A37 threonylcarbamoyladenosine dehydratase
MALNPLFQRLTLLTGMDVMETLEQTRVMIFGVGGVGSWCAEALARSGVGDITMVDSDTVCVTNINRQVQATTETIGRTKVEVLRERLLAINPRCRVSAWGRVFSRETAEVFGLEGADYIIDAIDSLTHKLDLIELASMRGIPLFSCMGMAQKLDPTRLKTADIWETMGCPLARLVRTGLRKRGFRGHFTAVYSTERLPLHGEVGTACGTSQCLCPARNHCGGERENGGGPVEWCSSKKVINGSSVTVTAAAGMILASLVLRDIYDRHGRGQGRREGRGQDCGQSYRHGRGQEGSPDRAPDTEPARRGPAAEPVGAGRHG